MMPVGRRESIRFKTKSNRELYKNIEQRIARYEKQEKDAEAKIDHRKTAERTARMEELDWIREQVSRALKKDIYKP